VASLRALAGADAAGYGAHQRIAGHHDRLAGLARRRGDDEAALGHDRAAYLHRKAAMDYDPDDDDDDRDEMETGGMAEDDGDYDILGSIQDGGEEEVGHRKGGGGTSEVIGRNSRHLALPLPVMNYGESGCQLCGGNVAEGVCGSCGYLPPDNSAAATAGGHDDVDLYPAGASTGHRDRDFQPQYMDPPKVVRSPLELLVPGADDPDPLPIPRTIAQLLEAEERRNATGSDEVPYPISDEPARVTKWGDQSDRSMEAARKRRAVVNAAARARSEAIYNAGPDDPLPAPVMNYAADPYIGPTQRARREAEGKRPRPAVNSATVDPYAGRPDLVMYD
jgi:hypothetical protein